MSTMAKENKSKPLNPDSRTFVPGKTTTTRTSSSSSAASAPPNPASSAAAAPPAVKSAWGSKPLDAVKAAPPPAPPHHQAAVLTRNNNGSSKHQDHQHRGGGKHSRGGKHHHQDQNKQHKQHSHHGGGGGGGKQQQQHHHGGSKHGGGKQQQQSHQNKTYKHNTNLANVKLCEPGQGTTPAQKAVVRYTCDDLLQRRLDYVDAPENNFSPPDIVRWTDEEREIVLKELMEKPRTTGDVSKTSPRRTSSSARIDTAPALEDCAPLEVNEETRWKAKVFEGKTEKDDEDDTDEAVLKRALLILNKLSLTKFDKLAAEFVDTGIGRNEACLHGAIELIVDKAQAEPHFSSMYAQLCSYLQQHHVGGGKKVFKKHLLQRCQEEFEVDTAHKIAKATEGMTDPEEIKYHSALIKKNYLGHMRFIGELYKIDMIKVDIMLWCLFELLKEEDKAEKNLECFAQLMTTIGYSLELQSQALLKEANKPEPAKKLEECWLAVDDLVERRGTHSPISSRIKFMLLDLEELRNNGWNQRRKVEEAKTIAQIHKDVAKEELARSRSGGIKPAPFGGRRVSSGDLDRKPKQEIVDKDGFVKVKRSTSSGGLSRSISDAAVGYARVTPESGFSRSKSYVDRPNEETVKEVPAVSFPEPHECGEKFKAILKEFFVGGDTDDAVLSLHEIIGVGHEGSVYRGAKAIEQGTMMVMEMKDDDVQKMLTILNRCLDEGKLEKKAVLVGLNDPLEFVSDIEIDAPLAGSHLATVIASMVKSSALSLDFLLEGPEYFRTDGKAAQLCAKVVEKLGGEPSESDMAIIEKLMTEEDKAAYSSVQELFASIKK